MTEEKDLNISKIIKDGVLGGRGWLHPHISVKCLSYIFNDLVQISGRLSAV